MRGVSLDVVVLDRVSHVAVPEVVMAEFFGRQRRGAAFAMFDGAVWRDNARMRPSAVAGGDQAGFVGVDHSLDAVAESEFAEQIGHVGLDGGF